MLKHDLPATRDHRSDIIGTSNERCCYEGFEYMETSFILILFTEVVLHVPVKCNSVFKMLKLRVNL